MPKHYYMVLKRSEIADGVWTEWRIQCQPTGFGPAKAAYSKAVELNSNLSGGWELKVVRMTDEPEHAKQERK